MAVGLCSLGLAGLGAGLCKRNSVLNILGRLKPLIPSTDAHCCHMDAAIKHPSYARPG